MRESSGARRVLNIVSNKWSAIVILRLASGSKRPSELMHLIDGISQKMLTQTLRQLAQGDLVTRKIYAVVPPRVDYTLTPLGLSLVAPLEVLRRWAQEHGAEIDALEVRRKQTSARAKGRGKPGDFPDSDL